MSTYSPARYWRRMERARRSETWPKGSERIASVIYEGLRGHMPRRTAARVAGRLAERIAADMPVSRDPS